jgi:DNA polymerase III subunit alpha
MTPQRVRARLSSFFHLHAHSEFSFKDALPAVPEMVATAAEQGHPALALTDHGNMAGAVQLYTECQERGIKPYPGLEAYFTPSVAKMKEPQKRGKKRKIERYHMGFVALDGKGYETLVKMSSRSHSTTNFHHKPHLDLNDLAEFSEEGLSKHVGLLTGCYFGYVIQTLVNQGEHECAQLLKTLAKWFPNTYVELQRHNIDHGDGWDDIAITEIMFDLANKVGLPVVITQDAHYCDPKDKPYHDAMKRMVSWGDDPDDAIFPGDGFHLCDYTWIEDHFDDSVGREMLEAAEEGWQDILCHEVIIPELDTYRYRVPSVVADPMNELVMRCMLRLEELGIKSKRYLDRLNEEFEVIEETGFAGYLMLVATHCDWMREQDIFYLARGSASGSLVCYLLEITQIDPLQWKLTVQRLQ